MRFALLLCLGSLLSACADQPPARGGPAAVSTFEELLVPTGPTSPDEDAALVEVLKAYRGAGATESFSAFDKYLAAHPSSAWTMALQANMGLAYYRTGYFSKAISALEKAWQAGKSANGLQARALTDRAVGELARMHARLGHAEELEALFKDMGDRPVTGPATETITGAHEGLWQFRHNPGVAYLCGPMALKNLLLTIGARSENIGFLDEVRSGPHGVSMTEVSALADRAKLEHTIVYRDPSQPIPVPSLVHWKEHHFAAIVAQEDNGLYRIKDPTFGNDLVVSRAAIDAEGSGYFLVPTKDLAGKWRTVRSEELGKVYGMGYTNTNDPNATKPDDTKAKPDCGNAGCVGYNFHEMVASLNLTDTPVGLTSPSQGQSLFATLTFNQREANQPANFTFFNVSPKWSMNFAAYIQDTPGCYTCTTTRYVAGGGTVTESGYTGNPYGSYAPEKDGSVLVSFFSGYQRNLPGGGYEVYGTSDNATSYPRRFFLTNAVDSRGRGTSFLYSTAPIRLTQVNVAGGSLTFSYNNANNLLVTDITDNNGRTAHITYDASGRLSSITDAIGIISSFGYDTANLVSSMTTPYGTTTFTHGDSGTAGFGNDSRWVQATDPLGKTERVEFNQTTNTPATDPANTVPTGMATCNDGRLGWRNTFYWDKRAYALYYAPNPSSPDYTKARIRHWVHGTPGNEGANITGETVESVKNPFENRVWFAYPGQVFGYCNNPNPPSSRSPYMGSIDSPSAIGRVLDDGSVQLTQLTYNALGNVTDVIDPLGRETKYTYAANNIDLLTVQQKTSNTPTYTTIATYANYQYQDQPMPIHEPGTYIDAAGKTWTYTYAYPGGQLLTVTDPLNHTTTYNYGGHQHSGGGSFLFLDSVTNANGKTQASFTPDGFGRVATATDSEGYTLSYQYDNFDRITTITYPDATTTIYKYDAGGNKKLDLVSVTDRQGRATTYTYDAQRNLVDILDPLGKHTQYTYYENGVRKTLKDARNNVTTWNLDAAGRPLSKVYQDGRTWTNAYETTTSRLKSVTDPLQQVRTYGYNKDSTLASIAYTGAVNATPNVSFTYDPFFSRVATMTDGSGTTNYTYVPIGSLGALSLQKEAGPFTNASVSYAYDALGRALGRTVDTAAESLTYDPIGRVTNHTSTMGSVNLGYLGQSGQLTSRILGGISTLFGYDTNAKDRKLLSITNPNATRSYQYTTSAENIVSSVAESGSGTAFSPQTWTFVNDDKNRLKSAVGSGSSTSLHVQGNVCVGCGGGDGHFSGNVVIEAGSDPQKDFVNLTIG